MSVTELISSLEEDNISLLDGSHLLLDFSADELRKLQNALIRINNEVHHTNIFVREYVNGLNNEFK